MELYKQKLKFYENSNDLNKINKYQNKIEQYGGGLKSHKKLLKLLKENIPYRLLLSFNNDIHNNINNNIYNNNVSYKPEIYVCFSDRYMFEKYALRYVSLIMFLIKKIYLQEIIYKDVDKYINENIDVIENYNNYYINDIFRYNLFNDLFFDNLFFNEYMNMKPFLLSNISMETYFNELKNKLKNIINKIRTIISDKFDIISFVKNNLSLYDSLDNNILYFSDKNKSITKLEQKINLNKYIYIKINYINLNEFFKNESSKIFKDNNIEVIESDDKEIKDILKSNNYSVILKLPHYK